MASRCGLREDGDHFAAGTSRQDHSLQAFGENLDEFHVVGLTARSHFARNARHVDDHKLGRMALVDDVFVQSNRSVPSG